MATVGNFDSRDDLEASRTVLAIGRPAFAGVLINTLRNVAGVSHCMVFSFSGDGSANCLLNIGDIPTGAELGEAYAGYFHASDPNKEVIFMRRAGDLPITLPSFSRRMYSYNYWRVFFRGSNIVDKFATAVWFENTCFYVNFYRILSQGAFDYAESQRLGRIAPSIGAAVARHFDTTTQGNSTTSGQVLGKLFASANFDRLTVREKDVCLRILLGYSSEGIAGELNIGLQSVLTYRRRAYSKLGISSQNELFAMVLRIISCSPSNVSQRSDLN